MSAQWIGAEHARLLEAFHDDDAPTADELEFLATLSGRADSRGEVSASRAELAQSLGWAERSVGAAISWAQWRGSLTLRRVSSKSEPPAYRFRLREWPHGPSHQAPGA